MSPLSGVYDVVIVGGGFSGAAAAIHLSRCDGARLRVGIVEHGGAVGRGVAYGVRNHVFRLNVVASKMSLDPDSPDDFRAWASADASAFLPRSLYGDYVEHRFREARARGNADVDVLPGVATAATEQSVSLVDGTVLRARIVILATGIAPRVAPSALPNDPRIVDAWDENALATLPMRGELLVLGSGLSAVDVILLLESRGFSGRVTVLSRRGLLPRPHLRIPALPVPVAERYRQELPDGLGDLLAWTRSVVRAAVDAGHAWQAALDGLRPLSTELWRRLPPRDRARFARSVRPYWDPLRHRVAFETRGRIEGLRQEGRVEVLSGAVVACSPTSEGLAVTLQGAGTVRAERRFHGVVRCIGPALALRDADAPLIADLVATGRACLDPAGLGIVTDEAGRVVRPDGVPQATLYTLGALRRASAWETTSAPDIAVQARDLARVVARLLLKADV